MALAGALDWLLGRRQPCGLTPEDAEFQVTLTLQLGFSSAPAPRIVFATGTEEHTALIGALRRALASEPPPHTSSRPGSECLPRVHSVLLNFAPAPAASKSSGGTEGGSATAAVAAPADGLGPGHMFIINSYGFVRPGGQHMDEIVELWYPLALGAIGRVYSLSSAAADEFSAVVTPLVSRLVGGD